jgi:hypothetical protein
MAMWSWCQRRTWTLSYSTLPSSARPPSLTRAIYHFIQTLDVLHCTDNGQPQQHAVVHTDTVHQSLVLRKAQSTDWELCMAHRWNCSVYSTPTSCPFNSDLAHRLVFSGLWRLSACLLGDGDTCRDAAMFTQVVRFPVGRRCQRRATD